jgi:hypothetical protein
VKAKAGIECEEEDEEGTERVSKLNDLESTVLGSLHEAAAVGTGTSPLIRIPAARATSA